MDYIENVVRCVKNQLKNCGYATVEQTFLGVIFVHFVVVWTNYLSKCWFGSMHVVDNVLSRWDRTNKWWWFAFLIRKCICKARHADKFLFFLLFPCRGVRLVYRSLRSTATFVTCFHWSLLLAFSLHFSSSSAFLRSLYTQSSHLRRGLPRFLKPSCFFVSDIFGNLSSFILTIISLVLYRPILYL